MNETGARVAYKNFNEAMALYMMSHSAGIWQRYQQEECAGSATCIKIGNRLFLATAAHNFQDIPKGGTVDFISATLSSRNSLYPLSYNYGEYGAEGRLDLAWVEIDPASASRANLRAVTLDSLETFHAIELDTTLGLYEIVGFPFALTKDIQKYAHPSVRHLFRQTW